MRVRLLPGVTLEQAVQEFRFLGGNIHSATSVVGGDISDQIDAYVRWSVATELRLSTIMGRLASLELLDTPRHRALCSILPVKQAAVLLHAEIAAKGKEFGALEQELAAEQRAMRGTPGHPTVLDSNVLLQAKLPDQIAWSEILDRKAVRLMIPLRVIEELDAKKYGDSRRLRQVARTVLPWLEERVVRAGERSGPLPGRPGTTIEVLLPEGPRLRPQDADEEILSFCDDIVHLAGTVTLVTADTGMKLRARARQIEVVSLPSIYLRLDSESGTDAPGPGQQSQTPEAPRDSL